VEEQGPTNRRARRAAEKTGGATPVSKDPNRRLREEAANRRNREGQRLETGEKLDDVLMRSTDAASKFVGSNFAWLQWIVVFGIAGGMGYLIWDYRQGLAAEKSGDRLAHALLTDHGKLSTEEAGRPNPLGLEDTRPEFATAADRAKAAGEQWAKVQSADPVLGPFADVAKATALLDAEKWGEARKAFEAIAQDTASAKAPLVRERALEGIMLSYEGESDFIHARDAARKLKDLEGSHDLGSFHEARLGYVLGEKDAAKETLTKLAEKLGKGRKPGEPGGYLLVSVEELLKTLDPKPVAEEPQITPEALERLKKQLEEMQKNMPASPQPGAP
jgi:hypothetical protein